jgi:hypothetical protein
MKGGAPRTFGWRLSFHVAARDSILSLKQVDVGDASRRSSSLCDDAVMLTKGTPFQVNRLFSDELGSASFAFNIRLSPSP